MNNLSTEYTHEFKVCGATRSIYNGSIVLYGEFSKTHQVCDYTMTSLMNAHFRFVITILLKAFSGKTKYHTGKDHYCWSRGKSKLFLKTRKYFSVLINKLDCYGTNGSPSLSIRLNYSFFSSSSHSSQAVSSSLPF